jgi:serine/threonine-protein kinase
VQFPDDGEPIDPKVAAELDDPDLALLAEAILDGTSVNWNSAAGADARHHATLQQLRVLAEVVDVHRGTALVSDSAETSPGLPAAPQPAWGPLTLHERIGAGAFGEVFRAWDNRLDREVALKLLRPSSPLAVDGTTKSIEEGRLLARVRHPNVVQVYGAERIEGRVGLWTEFIRGRTLAEFVRQHGRLSAQEAIAVGVDLARALSAVHKAGLLHRDIKPQNVMREDGGRTVLMDFGAGRERVEETLGGANDLTGTPLYLAPELWARAEATPRSDIYSLGVLLYYLVTETHPVRGKTSAEVRDAQAAGRRVWLRDERPDLPEAFVDVVERALATDPDARYESAGALETALRNAQHPGGSLSKGSDAVDRSTVKRIAMFAALVVVVATGLVMTNAGGLRDRLFAPRIVTLALLPVKNISGDPAQDAFAAGMTELVQNKLGLIASLELRTYQFVEKAKDANRTLTDVARALDVDAVLEVSTKIEGDNISLRLQLAQVAPRAKVWLPPDYRHELTIAHTLENRVIRDVANALHLSLRPTAQARLAEERTLHPRALPNVTRSRTLLRVGTADSRREAHELLLEAIALEPDYAEAYETQALLFAHGGNFLAGGRKASQQRSREAANKALQLDEWSAEAHTALGYVDAAQWNKQDAEREFKLAIATNPNLPLAHTWYSQYLSAVGKDDEALAEANWALRLEPDNPGRVHAIYALYIARRYDEAARLYHEVLAQDPDSWGANAFLSRLEIVRRRGAEAVKFARRVAEIRSSRTGESAEGDPIVQGTLAAAYAVAGNRDEADRIIRILENQPNQNLGGTGPRAPLFVALAHLWRGNRERALELMWIGKQNGAEGLFFLNRDPLFDAIRDTPDYSRLTRCVFFALEAAQANDDCEGAAPRERRVTPPTVVPRIK